MNKFKELSKQQLTTIKGGGPASGGSDSNGETPENPVDLDGYSNTTWDIIYP